MCTGRSLYLMNECSGTVTVFDYDDKTKSLKEKQTISAYLPEDQFDTKELESIYPKNFGFWAFSAHIMVTPDERHVITANRGHNSLTVFDRKSDGTLKLNSHYLTGGNHPRNFDISKDGKIIIVAN